MPNPVRFPVSATGLFGSFLSRCFLGNRLFSCSLGSFGNLSGLGSLRSIFGSLATRLAGRTLFGDCGFVNLDLDAKLGSGSLHGEADATTLGVDFHDLHLDDVADLDNLRRSLDVARSHLGDVHQALGGLAQLDECAERNNLGDRAVDDGANRISLDKLYPRIGLGLLGPSEMRSRFRSKSRTSTSTS